MDLRRISLEQLQTRVAEHAAGRKPHLTFVLVSHVPWPSDIPWRDFYQSLCEHHATSAPWEGPERHLMIDRDGGFWIDAENAWLPSRIDGCSGAAEPAPALIDMAVDTDPSRQALRRQLQSVASAVIAIGSAFRLDDVPSVRWQSVRLRKPVTPPGQMAVPTACFGGV
ncbi:MAG: hypothetical protein R3F01_07455 [Lysobacteraceae bacterium]